MILNNLTTFVVKPCLKTLFHVCRQASNIRCVCNKKAVKLGDKKGKHAMLVEVVGVFVPWD